MKRLSLELAVGVFMVIAIACLAYLSVHLGDVNFFGDNMYQISAQFDDIGGLRPGAEVTIAGVSVGEVTDIRLNDDYYGEVTMDISQEVRLFQDAIAAVKTRGLIGEKYVSLSPGGAAQPISPGGKIRDTQPAVDLESVISEFVHGQL